MSNDASATVGPPARRFALGIAALFMLVLAVYWPALHGQFVWDDRLLIDKNPLVKGDLNLASVWFQTDYPLSMVALWLQWLAWGNSATGYHAVNVLLHAINAVLLWRLLARLKIPGSWIGAAIFAVHPVCVMSVAWISELKNTLSQLFFLLSTAWYLKFDDRQTEHVSPGLTRWYWLSLIAFLLALFSKTSTVMLPLVLVGCAWWRHGRLTKRDFWLTSPFFVLSLMFGLTTIWFQKHGAIAGATVQTETFLERLALAGRAVWFYLGKAFLPLNLNVMYPRWDGHTLTLVSYLPVVLLCVVFGIFWMFRQTWGRHNLFALGFFTVSLFPVLGFFDMYFLAISRVSDHFQYISLLAVAAVVGAMLSSLLKPTALKCVTPVLLAALSFLTFQRATVFATEETLWNDTLAKNPEAWSAYNNLGVILAEEGKTDEAMREFELSLKFNPRNPKAHVNLGRALSMQGKFAEAESHFRTAIEIKPQDADAHKLYAESLASQGRATDAIEQLHEAIQIEPDVDSRLQLAQLLHQSGKYEEAIEQCRQVLKKQPTMPEALNNIAWLLATAPDAALRNGKEAVQFAEQACRLTDFKQAALVGTLAASYAEAGRFDEAVNTAQKAISLAASEGNTNFASINQQLLGLYRARRPYHEPSSKAD